MKTSTTKLILTLLAAALLLLPLASCHGSRGPDAFVLPDEFDTSRNYEITFWAKNDTNQNQTAIYKRAIEEFQTQIDGLCEGVLHIVDALGEHGAFLPEHLSCVAGRGG